MTNTKNKMEEPKKVRVVLHKNELSGYLVIPGTYKLGEEKLRRWVDVPEYIEVTAVEAGLSDYSRGYQLGYLKGQDDAKTEFRIEEKMDNEVIEMDLSSNMLCPRCGLVGHSPKDYKKCVMKRKIK